MAMMDTQLNSWLLFGHAGQHFADTEIVSQVAPGKKHRYTYADYSRRTQQLMHALDKLGIDRGEAVATMAWNGYRHLELYFAIPCTGRVLHTLNLRLSTEDLTYIIDHAQDRAIFVDGDLLPILEKVGEGLAGIKHVIVMGDNAGTSLPNVIDYEDLIAGEPDHYDPVDIPEGTPFGLCYTSGTTGRPKGAVYTHRSTFLHSMGAQTMAGLGIGPQDSILPIVPMFHANAWGMAHAGVACGSKLVFTGSQMDGPSVVDLMESEGVTVSGGVPTIWLGVLEEMKKSGKRLPLLRHVACGGSQPPRALIEGMLEVGVNLIQAWGMTETSPLASMSWPKYSLLDLDADAMTSQVRCQAGLPLTGVDIAIRDDQGKDVPWDGESMGDLLVRGPWVVDSYLHGDGAEQFTEDGWFRTGDVAVGSPNGYFVIADRTKDLIKSGGEWISSVDMEGAIMAMPGVAEAAVIAIPDAKWAERPLACVVPRDGTEVTLDQVHAHLQESGFAKWQLPDRVEIIEAVPRTSVGKFDKKVLRARFPQ
ncbi:MAG: long-chain fatty acid--CoA ligase [Candidatus Dormibacteraeota bacterium]|nr:long-chain fatty acid--CoA ligase [Candidatus Dormibacteraeota bacterium]